ncbi:MAG: peptide chain release factor N(5)-glutamine methyltransferase [Bacteroidales bacterium]|nr:peptide chain release factor N(5)-glutamine methyltransferase [Bacteroidales bacterium]
MIGFNLNKAKRHFTEALAEVFPQREAEQLMRTLLEDLFDIDLKRQLLEPELRIDERQHALLESAVKRLLQGEPVQYVTGKAHFDGLVFQVDPSVLIPRPETEELVWKIAETLPADQPLRIWDVGTGSGCIAIALAKRLPMAEVVAFDFSEEALAMARQNAESNGVDVTFVCDDVLHPQSEEWHQPVDLVVSNPPYVRASERASMERNVLDYEPSTALFVPDDDSLLYYRQILKLAKSQLNPDGVLWFEINEAKGHEMLLLCQQQGFQARLFEDFAGKPRFVHASRLLP